MYYNQSRSRHGDVHIRMCICIYNNTAKKKKQKIDVLRSKPM